jgi:hypothetical protein
VWVSAVAAGVVLAGVGVASTAVEGVAGGTIATMPGAPIRHVEMDVSREAMVAATANPRHSFQTSMGEKMLIGRAGIATWAKVLAARLPASTQKALFHITCFLP